MVPEPRPVIPAAAATGYDAAYGEVIARCDADSRPPADWLERIVRPMAEQPGLDALTGDGRFYDLPAWVEPMARHAYLGSYYVLVHAATGQTTLGGSNTALRSQTWREVRHLVHLDPGLHDDTDLAFCLGAARRVRYDRRLVVGVCARYLRGRHQVRRRLDRALPHVAGQLGREPAVEAVARRAAAGGGRR